MSRRTKLSKTHLPDQTFGERKQHFDALLEELERALKLQVAEVDSPNGSRRYYARKLWRFVGNLLDDFDT